MGAWGPGLYSSDIAADLRAQISAIVRLPLADAELWPLAATGYEQAAGDPSDEDHSTFWLVVAHQFAKKGVDCPHAREKALAIIESGSDIEMMRALDMTPADLRKRQKNLEKIRAEILEALASPKKRGPVIKTPQPFLMEIGDCFAYPTMKKEPFNPYFPRKETSGPYAWMQDGWGAAILLERGHALGHLAWYRLAGIDESFSSKPSLAEVRKSRIGPGLTAGVCPRQHLKKMDLELIGRLPVIEGAIHKLVPELAQVRSPDMSAILDIGIVGNLEAGRCGARGFRGVAVSDLLAPA